MNTFLLCIAILVAVLTAICLYRLAVGPTVFDRVISAGLVGTNGVILLVLIGFLYHRIDMFIDIAIVYALLNFMMVIILSRYFERGGGKPE